MAIGSRAWPVIGKAGCAALVAVWVALAPALAQGTGAEPPPSEIAVDPNFAQAGIPAEASADNAVLARDAAFASARRLAWDRMLAEAGLQPRGMSPSQLERLVSSMVIEQERVSPTRYSGRLTVNFAPGPVRAALGRGGAPADAPADPTAPARPGPAVASVEAVASYRGLAEWLDLRRRLQGAAPVAAVEILGLTTESARLRLALRTQPADAASALSALGIQILAENPPTPGPPAAWRVRLAGG